MKFSIIVPVHNGENFLPRCLSSFTRQGISKDDFEVILVDDNSTDGGLNIVHYYEDDLNIVLATTNTETHCPGNTRQVGLDIARGEWVCFCDQDDYFTTHTLLKVQEFIDKTNEQYSVCANFVGETGVEGKTKEYKQTITWLHGKFYNRENLIRKYSIKFKEDLVTHEDIYFNCCVVNRLYEMHRDFAYLDIIAYTWCNNEKSLSREQREDRGYFVENFADYLYSASEPFWENAIKTRDPLFINLILMTLLHAYFYYMEIAYYMGEQKDCLRDIKTFLNRIIDEIDLSLDTIILFICTDPIKYNLVRQECMDIALNPYIEQRSFIDFVRSLIGEEYRI